MNEIQLSYKYHMPTSNMPKVGGSADAYRLLIGTWDESCIDLLEQSKVMLLNRAHKVLGLYNVGSGGLAAAPMDTRLVLVAALKTNAASIILAHNHPSGNLLPSEADKAITEKFKNACQLLDIKMLDHIIVCRDGYYSFTEGMAFDRVGDGVAAKYECRMPF